MNIKMSVQSQEVQPEIWSTLQPEPYDAFNASVFPSPAAEVSFAAHDDFFPSQSESFSLGYVEREQKANRCVFSLNAEHNEKFAGTGERFAGMNLAGKTFILENMQRQNIYTR